MVIRLATTESVRQRWGGRPGKLVVIDVKTAHLNARLEQGEQVRGGTDNRDVLTTYTGTVAGDVVSGIIPSATGDFDATYTVSDDDELRSMELTGDFYGAGSMTYSITFADYGAEPSISAPE